MLKVAQVIAMAVAILFTKTIAQSPAPDPNETTVNTSPTVTDSNTGTAGTSKSVSTVPTKDTEPTIPTKGTEPSVPTQSVHPTEPESTDATDSGSVTGTTKPDRSTRIPGGFGKYFFYVNCTNCDVEGKLIVQKDKDKANNSLHHPDVEDELGEYDYGAKSANDEDYAYEELGHYDESEKRYLKAKRFRYYGVQTKIISEIKD